MTDRHASHVGTSTRPAVTFVLPRLSGGGIERVFLNLAGGLAASGLEVEVVLLRQGSGPALIEVPPGVRCVDLAAPVVGDATFMLAMPALTRYLANRRPSVLYSGITTINLVSLVARARASADTAVVISEHVPLSVNASTHPLKRVLPALARRWYPSADVIVAVSEALADDLAATARLPRSRVETVYNPVVTGSLLAAAASPPDHHWFAADAPDAPVILGIGRLDEQKDFKTLLRAFAAVRSTRTARLVILGEGHQRSELLAEAARLGIGADVDLPGHVKRPAEYLGHADLFALSSAYEGFPTVLIEALACGCPVVSTDCPTGPREILEGGAHGRLVPVGDAPALAAAMEAELDTRRDREALERRGRLFTVEAAVERVRTLLTECGALPSST